MLVRARPFEFRFSVHWLWSIERDCWRLVDLRVSVGHYIRQGITPDLPLPSKNNDLNIDVSVCLYTTLLNWAAAVIGSVLQVLLLARPPHLKLRSVATSSGALNAVAGGWRIRERWWIHSFKHQRISRDPLLRCRSDLGHQPCYA